MSCCDRCKEDPNWFYCYCSTCGGEKDGEGNCSEYHDGSDPPATTATWLEKTYNEHKNCVIRSNDD